MRRALGATLELRRGYWLKNVRFEGPSVGDQLCHNSHRASLYLIKDAPHVFPEDPDRKQLNAAKKEDGKCDGCEPHARGELACEVPGQDDESPNKSYRRNQHPRQCCNAKREERERY